MLDPFGRAPYHRVVPNIRRLLAPALAVALLVAAPAALGLRLAAAATPGTPDAETEAKTLFKEARSSYDVGKFADALDKLERAYALFPTPVIQFNLAQVHRAMGHLKEARFLFVRYSDSMKKELEAATKKKDRAAIEAKIANVAITIAELDKAIADGLDKTEVPKDPGPPPETKPDVVTPEPPHDPIHVEPPPATPAKPVPWGKVALYGGVGLGAALAVTAAIIIFVVQPGHVRVPDTALGFQDAFR
jgi:tetratricopeptide (TPR) repeat protein